MIKLYDNDSGAELGSIDEAQLQFLIDNLEEETSADQDYFLNPSTLDLLEERGADSGLLAMLRQAIEGKEGVEIRWSQGA